MTRVRAGIGAAMLLPALLCSPASALEWPGRNSQILDELNATDASRRAAAIQRLTWSDADAAAPLLERAATDPDTSVRLAAAEWIATHRVGEAESVAIGLLSDRRPEVRAAAAAALGSLRTAGALDPLVRALADREASVRIEAIDALAALGRPEAVLALIEATQDSTRDVAVAAVESLGRLGDPAAVFALLEKLHDPVESVAVAAAGALGQLRAEEAVPGLMELAQTGRAAEVSAALAALSRIGSREAVPLLLSELLNPRFPESSGAALDALLAIPDPRVPQAVLPYLGQRAEAETLLLAAGPDAWPLLRSAWRDGAERTAEALLRVWLQSGDPRALVAAESYGSAARLGDDDRLALLGLVPTEEGVCARIALGAPADAAGWDQLLEQAARAGSGRCLVDLVEAAPPASRPPLRALALTLEQVDDVDPARVLNVWLDVDALDVETAAIVGRVALRSGEDAAPLLVRMLGSRDAAIRREAAWVLAELDGTSLSLETLEAILERAQHDPEHAAAVAAMHRGPWARTVREAVVSWLASANPLLRAEAWLQAAENCELVPADAAEGVRREQDYWARVSSARALVLCGRRIPAGALEGLPGLAALAVQVRAEPPTAQELLDRSAAVDVRVARLARVDAPELLADGVFEDLARDPSAAVRAAAHLVAARLDRSREPSELALLAAASESALERQVLTVIARRAGDVAVLARVVRTATDSDVARIALADEPAYEAPVQVVVVDHAADAAMAWQPVFVVWDDLTFALERTDGMGRVRIARPGVVVAWPLGLEQ